MALHFKYKPIDRPDGRVVKSPSIPVTLIGKMIKYDVIGLIDSGADISVIPRDMADLLGLDLKNKSIEESRGIGGKVRTIETSMKIIVEGKKSHEKYSLTLPVNVILDGDPPPLLLGRAGFFDNFVITFDESKQKVKLKKINPNRLWAYI